MLHLIRKLRDLDELLSQRAQGHTATLEPSDIRREWRWLPKTVSRVVPLLEKVDSAHAASRLTRGAVNAEPEGVAPLSNSRSFQNELSETSWQPGRLQQL